MAAKVVSFMNMKGGVGKTTLCVNLAYSLSKINKKVLMIDIDPQSNMSQYILTSDVFGDLIAKGKTLYSLYDNTSNEQLSFDSVNGDDEDDDDTPITLEDIIYPVNDNLDLIPGNIMLVKISQGVDPSVIDILKNFFIINKLYDKYDYVFLDCPPTQSIYTSSALSVSTHYILPVKPDFLSSIGIALMKNIIRNHNRTHSQNKIECAGIIFNIVHKSDYDFKKMKEIRDSNIKNVYENYIINKPIIAKAPENAEYMLNLKGCKRTISNIRKEFLCRMGELKNE